MMLGEPQHYTFFINMEKTFVQDSNLGCNCLPEPGPSLPWVCVGGGQGEWKCERMVESRGQTDP